MNSKHLKTLHSIRSKERKSINWDDIEKMMIALGATTRESRGSGATFTLNNYSFAFHRPHPEKEAKPYQIKQLKQFLIKVGVVNE
jgi:hypothetical protein